MASALTSYFKKFFTPEYLASFHGNFREIQVLYFTAPGRDPQRITLKPYPFMTLYDLKVMIYQQLRKEISAHPSFQFLGIPIPISEVDPTVLSKNYMSFDYSWTKAESTSPKDVFYLDDPFARISGPAVDTQFVTESGKKNISFAQRSRVTLEDFTAELFQSRPLILHLFLYKDLLPGLREELRTSEREWFGRISPYFPDVEINQASTTLTEKQRKRIQIFDAYVTNTLDQINKLDRTLTSAALLPIVVSGVKFLRLVWKESLEEEDTRSLETMFYQVDVTHERPFLRILPQGSTPITKIMLKGSLKNPDISDPRLLLQWKDERNPKPDKDFLFSKVIIREKEGSQPALYGTLRMFPDGSADFLVLPPKQLRFLDPASDLSALGSLLERGFNSLPIETSLPDIGSADIICAIRLPLQSKLLTTDSLRKRLLLFSSLFQEIPALPGDKPLLMLRYRGVSNYAIEDRIYTFLTLLVSRTIARGDAAIPELVLAVQKEFQMTDEDAQTKVIHWLRNRGNIDLAIPETKDFIMTYNPGVDIALFAQRSYYTIHMYRVDSHRVFKRIITALSLLLSTQEVAVNAPPAEVAVASNLANAVVVAAPGVDPVVQERSAGDLPAAPAGVERAEENADDGLGSANNSDPMYLALMMGAPGAEEQGGDGEFFNLGDAVENERRNNVGNVDIAGRAAEEERAAAVATERALAAAGAPIAAAPPVPPPRPAPVAPAAAAAEPDEEEEEPVAGRKKLSYQGWVKAQLQTADQRLFMYKTDVAGRKIKKYVTMCQATESRQPYVLNQQQFDVMRETYAGDPEVIFVVYPLEHGEPLPEAGDEVYTLLKYGTNPLRQNYYLCCQFFCTKDYIMVREKDFYSPVDRQGKPKPGESAPNKKDNGSCPFCHGTEIKVLKTPRPGETVIQRRSKKGESKRHLYVSFLQGETQHPEEFYMPCCFTEDTQLYSSDPRFDKVRSEEEVEAEEEVRTVSGIPAVSYQVTMYRAHKKYIVGPEKEYLKISEIDGPQIGLLPPVLDKYFGQDPREFVSREGNKMELLPNSDCFLRIGVENRTSYRHDSFFAALAPYLEFRNNANAVKARIKEVLTTNPRIFTYLNYGNLVLEFYDAGDDGPATPELLRRWMSDMFQIDEIKESNKDACLRLWKSYHRFMGFLDSTQLKEYRQFAQMLALPGLLTPRGLVLIVLELNEKDELRVKCPPFGFNIDQYSTSDIGFILHRSSGIWEPLFFSENRLDKGRERHQPEITFQNSLEAGWPAIVKQRVREFKSQCVSIGRSVYTSSRAIDSKVLLPLSRAAKVIPPYGVVRDSYNHVVAVVYKSPEKKSSFIALPVIDDEYMGTSMRALFLDWDDFKPAPMDAIVDFYNQRVLEIFSLLVGYKPIRKIKSHTTEEYVAIQLENGLFIPASAPKDPSKVESLDTGYVDEMEWSLNREIYFAKKGAVGDEETLLVAQEQDMQEIFQHLRLTFSNWFGSEAVSSEVRLLIKKIIDTRTIPLFERRKRLEILLGPTILSWMDDRSPMRTSEGSLLRVDCHLRAEPTCSGKCVWRQATNGSVGKCYLHTPQKYRVGRRLVDGKYLLMKRLIEELLRFPDRKQQLLSGTVPTLVSLKDAVRIGDQYVLPEGSVAWNDLLRLDWIQSDKEQKKYFEEFSRKGMEEEKEAEEGAWGNKGIPLPPVLREFLGADDPKTSGLFLIRPDSADRSLTPLLVLLGLTSGNINVEESSSALNKESTKRLALEAKRPIVFIDGMFDPLEVFTYIPKRGVKTSVPFVIVSINDMPYIVSSMRTKLRDVTQERMPRKLLELVKAAKEI